MKFFWTLTPPHIVLSWFQIPTPAAYRGKKGQILGLSFFSLLGLKAPWEGESFSIGKVLTPPSPFPVLYHHNPLWLLFWAKITNQVIQWQNSSIRLSLAKSIWERDVVFCRLLLFCFLAVWNYSWPAILLWREKTLMNKTGFEGLKFP